MSADENWEEIYAEAISDWDPDAIDWAEPDRYLAELHAAWQLGYRMAQFVPDDSEEDDVLAAVLECWRMGVSTALKRDWRAQ